MNEHRMQILEDGHWIDVHTRARTENGFRRLYRQMMRDDLKKKVDGRWPPNVSVVAGMRIITVRKEHLGAL